METPSQSSPQPGDFDLRNIQTKNYQIGLFGPGLLCHFCPADPFYSGTTLPCSWITLLKLVRTYHRQQSAPQKPDHSARRER